MFNRERRQPARLRQGFCGQGRLPYKLTQGAASGDAAYNSEESTARLSRRESPAPKGIRGKPTTGSAARVQWRRTGGTPVLPCTRATGRVDSG